MANTGKYVSSAEEINERAAKLAALFEIKPSIKPYFMFEVADAAALLLVDEKTLQRRRARRDALLKAGEEPDPLDIESIPYVPPNPSVKYTAQALEDYLKRVAMAANAGRRGGPSSVAEALERAEPASARAVDLMGFQTWLSSALPESTWPFSIQPDGRPLDLCAAIVQGKLTGKAERFTIRDFGNRVAEASAKAFHDAERAELYQVAAQCIRRSGH